MNLLMKIVPEIMTKQEVYPTSKTAFGSWLNRQKTAKNQLITAKMWLSPKPGLMNYSNFHAHGALPLGPRRRLPPRTPLSGAAAPEPPQYAIIQTNSNKCALRTLRTCLMFIRMYLVT